MAPKGEKSFSTSDLKKTTNSFAPFPAGDYDLKLRADKAEIRRRQNDPTAFPYISIPFQALGTGGDSGKDRFVYHMLLLRLKPDKNGNMTQARADQLKGLSDALADDCEASTVEVNGEDTVSAKDVMTWLRAHDGDVVRGHVKIQAGTKEYPDPKNVISEFIEAEVSAKTVDDEDEDEEESDEEVDDLDAAAKKNPKRNSASLRA